MGPDDLDNLLSSIRAESKPKGNPSALQLYTGTKQDELVTEIVDERILNLLGLQDTFDIDYATYISLLREKAGAARMTGRNFSTEEAELITNEFRRVKRKVGRFKVQKKKINAASVSIRKPIKSVNQKALAPATAPAAAGGEFIPVVKSIDAKLDELLAAVKADFKAEQQKERVERKNQENQRRRAKEGRMETKESPIIKSLKNTAKRIISPFQAIMDRIFKFIGFTLLGFGVDKIFKWFADPANQKKIETIGRFLKDWWPTLLGAAGLFFTPLGKFVRGTMRLLKMFTPALFRLAKSNPIATGLLAAGGTALTLAILNQGQVDKQRDIVSGVKPSSGVAPSVPQLTVEGSRGAFQFSNGGIVPRTSSRSIISQTPFILTGSTPAFNGGGIISRTPTISDSVPGMKIGFSGGGAITRDTGLNITGAGADTQLIAAKPGEIVLPTETVNKYGAGFFMDLIRASGKSGKPKYANNIQLAQNGGIIGALANMGLPGTGTVMAPKGHNLGFQDKIFGINIGNRRRLGVTETYNQESVDRYNRLRRAGGNRDYLRKGYRGRHYSYTPSAQPVQPSSSSSSSLVGDAFKNFGRNVQTIKGAAKRQEEMMRELGYEPDGYVNLRGQPINLGPQSSIQSVGTPVVSTETKMIVLPPKTTVAQKDQSVKTGTDIPDFSPIASVAHRMRVTEALGISNLV